MLNYKITPNLQEISKLRHAMEADLSLCKQLSQPLRQLKLISSEWLTNLIKHQQLPDAPLQITVELDHQHIHGKIRDQGQNFTDFQQKIQALDTQVDAIEESGRGFYLIKTLCSQFDYKIIETDDQQFNQFSFSISLDTNSIHTKKIIALIEDDPASIFIIEKYLNNDYQICCYPDGESFLANADLKQLALIISDINLPKINGIEICQQLKSKQQTQLIPFIFLSSNQENELMEQAINLGIDDFIKKPVSKKQLLQIVERVLKRNASTRIALEDKFSEQVTAALKPSTPTNIKGFTACVASRQAGSGGGDFILHWQNNEVTNIILADVMGHGETAKFHSHLYAGYLHGKLQALSEQQDIDAVFNNLSKLIYQDDYLQAVIITCLGLSCYPDGSINIVSAGHPAPILADQNNLRTVNISGALPGMLESTKFKKVNIGLDQQRLYAYTDGLFESSTDLTAQQENQNKIKKIMKSSHNQDLDAAVEKIMQEFDRQCQQNPRDDATLIVLELEKVTII